MNPTDPHDEAVEAAAAMWLARCDRVLSPAEQDAYLEWLRGHPSHGKAVAKLRQEWARLDRLGQWQPSHSRSPNPDLLAPTHRPRWRLAGAFALAAALVVMGIFTWQQRQASVPESRGARVLPGAERVALEDGSLVELNAGAKIEGRFSHGERRVRLVSGEALFSVAKDPERPFIVESGSFEVRALGTAFCVQPQAHGISVLVTEGEVRVDEARVGGATRGTGSDTAPLARLSAGRLAVVAASARAGASPDTDIRETTPAEMDAMLAWRAIRLEFDDLPLRDVVTEFNRFNDRQLVIHDVGTGAIVVGGSFRADNLDTFVRLLDSGFNVSAESTDREIVLRRRR